MSSKIQTVEICCGLGGTRKALVDAGFFVQQSIDIDLEVCRFHRYFWGDVSNLDITAGDLASVKDGDVLSAGFPCQPFSTSGYRTGFEHEQGNVFDSLITLIKNRSFKAVFLENVTGLLSNDGGATFKVVLGSLSQIYKHVEWQVTNLIELGIPQNRPRLVIISHNFASPVLTDVQLSPQADIFGEIDGINFDTHIKSGLVSQMEPYGRITDNRLLHTTLHNKYTDVRFDLTDFILGREFVGKVNLRSGRFWGRTGKTTFYVNDKPYSHSVGTSMGAAPTFGLLPEEVDEKVRLRITSISNWQAIHSGYYVFRLTPKQTLTLFGPRAETFGTAIEEFESSLVTKYKLIGNMFAPDQAYPALKSLFQKFN